MKQQTTCANLFDIKIPVTSRDAITRVTCTDEGEKAKADSVKARKRKREERSLLELYALSNARLPLWSTTSLPRLRSLSRFIIMQPGRYRSTSNSITAE